jgi:hypothetical protein
MISGRIGSVILFGLTSFLALREFVTMTPTKRGDHGTLLWVFFIITPIQYVLVAIGWYGLFSIFIPVYAFLFVPLRSALAGDCERFLERTATIQWALMVCVYCVSHAPALMTLQIPGFAGQNGKLLFYFVLVVQASDVLQYRAAHAAFPHESTSDQWFGESQFESYRKLGHHITRLVFDGAGIVAPRGPAAPARPVRERMFVALKERWYPSSAAVKAAFSKHADRLNTLQVALRRDDSLRFLDAMDWHEFVETLSVVEQRSTCLRYGRLCSGPLTITCGGGTTICHSCGQRSSKSTSRRGSRRVAQRREREPRPRPLSGCHKITPRT